MALSDVGISKLEQWEGGGEKSKWSLRTSYNAKTGRNMEKSLGVLLWKSNWTVERVWFAGGL